MRTTKSFSFISYNTGEFLERVLNDFVSHGVIGRYYCVLHSPTDNKPDIKPHYHCYVEPLKQVDTEVFKSSFIQVVSDGVMTSIAIKPRCTSKFIDFYLYSIHNSDYLTAKCLVREDVDICPDCCIVCGDFSEDINRAFMFWIRKLSRLFSVSVDLLSKALLLRMFISLLEFPLVSYSPFNRHTSVLLLNYARLKI